MLIEKNLPQFVQKKVLIVTTSAAAARMFRAGDGVIEELELLLLPKPQYSDREGFSTQAGRQAGLSTGSAYEWPKQELQQEFLRSLRLELERIKQEILFDAIYLFAPDYMSRMMTELFEDEYDGRLKMILLGNLTAKTHPFYLLRAIEKRQAAERATGRLLDREAQKLLDKPRV